MKYTYEQFKQYIIDHGGVADARTTEKHCEVPAGTLLKFGISWRGNISSWGDDLNDKIQNEYDFDTALIWGGYKGLFEVEEDQKELRISVKTQKEYLGYDPNLLQKPQTAWEHYIISDFADACYYSQTAVDHLHNLAKENLKATNQFNQINQPKGKTFMNIVKFAKDLTLSPNERLFRKVGLQDEEGNWTNLATEVVLGLELRERGFKATESMVKMYCQEREYVISVIELDTLFRKFSAQLLEIAKKYEKEMDKK